MRRNKWLFLVTAVCLACGILVSTPEAAAAVEAICVPWQPANPSLPHDTYSGASVTLKGIARGGATEYRWDYGDGSPAMGWAAVTNSYNLGVSHTYTGSTGQLFIATLYVRDGLDEDQDDYPVRIRESTDLRNPSHLDVRINMAIDEGLWWLHRTMIRGTYGGGAPGYGQPYGYWNDSRYGYHVAATGACVDAFQLHGSKANGDYDNDPYVETVQRALNHLLYYTWSFNISNQPAGDPDSNSNGIGLVTNQGSSLYDSRQTYIGGICMVALASSGAPNRVATVGRANVYGRTYADIVQDMVDFFAWGQVEASSGWYGRGGWRYYANYGRSDTSTAQWPPLGMIAAEQNMGSIVPQFVRDELILYLDAMQNSALNNDNGGFRYDYEQTLYNDTKAAAGIICHEFLGTPLTDPRVEKAIGFIYRHWNDTGTSWDHTRLHGNSYGMYGVMKAFRIPEPDITEATEYAYGDSPPHQTSNSFDWYYYPLTQAQQGLAHYCVVTQQANGSWDDNVGENRVYDEFATGWRILVLLKGVTIIPPVALICDCDKQEYDINQDVHLDGSCSYHPDPKRNIVLYEWDLDDDGMYDATGVTTTIVGGFPAYDLYPVTLRVTDDNPGYLGGPQTDTFVCTVDVHPPPHTPHADADGPYLGWIGLPVTFDASGSWDPDNEIVSYEWDLDNDGLFGTDDDDCFGEADDAVGVSPSWTWYSPYSGVIGLKVTDAAYDEFESTSDTDYTTVEIGNHDPVADPDGPYIAAPSTTIVLDGSGSYDPDEFVGDSIVSYEWDLDNDGDFDDATGMTTLFTVGAVPGPLYPVGLKVTDSYGETDSEYTTVTVLAWEDFEVTELIVESKSYMRYNRRTGEQTFDMTLTNISADPISEPVVLVIEDISPIGLGALQNEDGSTAGGDPYFDVDVGPDGVLDPGETSAPILWRVSNPTRVRWSFSISVWSGLSGPSIP